MALSKNKKKEVIEKLEGAIKDAKSVVFVNFHGLKVGDTTQFRRKLRANGVGFYVSKKTLAKRALDTKKYEGTMPELLGEVGIAYSADLIAPAREVYEFQKKFKDNLSILGGVFESKYMNKEEMLAIALIPSQGTLRGMFVNVINSPIQGFVMALSEIAKKKA
jgi:large subunit ribosomal protein L10